MKYLITHFPHSSRNSKSDSSYSSFPVIELGINLMSQLLPSEGVNSDDISMGSSNSTEMNLDNNDEADH